MGKVIFNIPSEVKKIISSHPEVHWERLVRDILWSYAKKIELMDKITSRSKLTEEDVEALDKAIKADLLMRYKRAI